MNRPPRHRCLGGGVLALSAAVLAFHLLGSSPSMAVEAVKFRDCWLLFGGVNDVGYTHATNIGRIEAVRYLSDKYPDHTFLSTAVQNSFFVSEEERGEVIRRFLEEDECDYVVATSGSLLNGRHLELAEEHPNISFVNHQGNKARVPPEIPHNLIEVEGVWFETSFVAGAVAAAVTKGTSAGFVNAFETSGGPWQHAMGFAMGYLWSKPGGSVHIVTMDSYYTPHAEHLAAKLLVEDKGCGILDAHTDPKDLHDYVYSLGGDVLSIGKFVDLSTFVGDTAIFSLVSHIGSYHSQVMESSFLGKLTEDSGALYDFSSDGTIDKSAPLAFVAPKMQRRMSPFTSMVDKAVALEAEALAWAHLQENNPLCGARWRDGSPLPSEEGSCPDATRIKPVSYLDLRNVTYYDSFVDAGKECGGGGMYYAYDVETFDVICHPCPENTYRGGADGERAGASCTPCPGDYVSAPGAKICKLFVEMNYNYLGGIRYYGISLVVLVASISISFSAWVQAKREMPIVRASQPLFLHLLCLGTLVLGSSIAPLTIDDSVSNLDGCNKACVLFPWLAFSGFCLAFSALFSKILRINRIFKAARSCRRVTVTYRDVFFPLLLMLSLNALLCLLWTVIDPPFWDRVEVSDHESYGMCKLGRGTASKVLSSLLLALNVVALVLANIQSYQARTISDDFSESKYITLAMASILQIVLIGVPLSLLTNANPTANFFVEASIILVICMSLLLLIFVPKFVRSRNGGAQELGIQNDRQNVRRMSTITVESSTANRT